MQIKNHLLFNSDGTLINFVETPNKGGKNQPQYMVMYHSAATTMESSVNWFKNPNAQASAHLLIGRNDNITQFAPFNLVTWHAGRSQ